MPKAGWKGPDERWEQHSRPRARAALYDARSQGWCLKKSTGRAKVWGIITCGDPALPLEERCSTNILSTSGSADGSETAEYINGFVGKCTHQRTPTAVADALSDADALLAAAGRCLDAAQALIDAQGHRDLVEDYLAQSDAAATEADDLIEAALAEDELAKAADLAASAAAADAGTSVTLGPTLLAEHARDRAGDARALLDEDSSREARILKDRCQDIRNQARRLLADLQ
jgi:hypothetical protein